MTSITEAAQGLRNALRSFDPSTLSGTDAAALAVELAEVEKMSTAARLRAAARAEALGAHKSRGHASGGQWMAKAMGTTPTQAQRSLDTARAIEDLPQAKKAFMSGKISEQQAAEVAKAAVADPSAEAALVQTATTSDIQSLRDQARKTILKSHTDVEALHERQRKAREFSYWIDHEGMVAGKFRLPPEIGTPIVNRIDDETDRVYRKAYKEGRREPRAAYAADALAATLDASAGKGGSSRRCDLVVVVDLDALKRGHVHDGERCHIPGVGPVPVSVARDVAADAFLKGVLIDGCEIAKVRHFKRHINAELKTALSLGEVPELDGVVCAEPGCGRTHGLEWDHLDPRANLGPTEYKNLKKPRCRPHHKEKTADERRRGLHRRPTRPDPRAGPDP